MLLSILLAGCASTSELIPPEWSSVPAAPRIRAVQLDADGKVTTALRPLRESDVRVAGNALVRGDRKLTDAFVAIDSFDVSESRGEVVFSAKRADNFDIGLVSTDGSPINWVPVEAVDEVGVQWAPRGNKVSYIVRSKTGDFVRTVHIPTSAQLSIEFPAARIHTLGWDPAGERFAVAYSTPDASDRVETMQFRGASRRIAIPPAAQLQVEVATFGPDAVSLRPRDIAYGEKLPLVIWVDDEPFGWSDARADLMRNVRVACIVTKRPPAGEVRNAVSQTPWIDRARTFVVSGGQVWKFNLEVEFPDLTPGTGAVVQSSAARFIADQLKRTGTPNGSSQ